MKRITLLLAILLMGSGAWAQQRKQLSRNIHIKGEFVKDYEAFKKGTPFVLNSVIELKKAPKGVNRTQGVLIINGLQHGLPIDMFDHIKFIPHDKNSFWQGQQLSNELIEYYEKKGYQQKMREELALESDDYLRELEQNGLIYDDAAVEDYLQCLLLDIIPEQMAVKRDAVPQVCVLKSPAPDMFLLANNHLMVSTGLLAAIDTEAELYALLSRQMAHFVLDHAIITVNKNIARARRAEFWGAVLDGVAMATEEILYERYDHYEPGLVFLTNDIVQSLINDKIHNRMGLDYSKDQEREADQVAYQFMELMGKNPDALTTALDKIYNYYKRGESTKELSKYGTYGTLAERLEKLPQPAPLPEDRSFLKKTSTIVSYEAASQDYNKNYEEAERLAQKNIANGMACSDDYIMVARSLMKLNNSPETNARCMDYLNKADEVAKVTNLNICKMKILLLFRENKQMDAVGLLHEYRRLLDEIFKQPHTEDDAKWIAAEHAWAEKLLDRTYIL